MVLDQGGAKRGAGRAAGGRRLMPGPVSWFCPVSRRAAAMVQLAAIGLPLAAIAGPRAAWAQPTSLQDTRPLPPASGNAPTVDSIPRYDDPNDTGFDGGRAPPPAPVPQTVPLQTAPPPPEDPQAKPGTPSTSGEGDDSAQPGGTTGDMNAPPPPSDAPSAAAANPLSAYPWQPGHAAQLQILEKLSDRVTDVKLREGESHTVGHIAVAMRGCLLHAADAPPDSAAWLDIKADTQDAAHFSGWMLAKEPWVAVYESPLYDVRVVRCE